MEFQRYQVLKKLASGGMGAVYLAKRHGASELCVLKVLHQHLANDADISARFLREAEVSSLLAHKNVARLFDAGRDDGRLYLAVEYVPGRDLEAIFLLLADRGMKMEPELAIAIVLEVLEGLEHVHDLTGPNGEPMNLVHRDIGLRNVMIAHDGAVKVIDFGLVRARVQDYRTAPGMLMGTPRFMSPEQAVGESAIDRRSDLYAAGVLLFELLTGTALIKGKTPQEMLINLLMKERPRLSSVRDGLPRALDQVLEKALQKRPQDRYASAQEMSAAIREAAGALAGGRDTQARLAAMMRALFPAGREEALSALDEVATVALPDTRVGQPDTRIAPPDARIGQPDPRIGQPDPRIGQPDPRIGQPDPRIGQPDPRIGQPDPRIGQPDTRSGILPPLIIPSPRRWSTFVLLIAAVVFASAAIWVMAQRRSKVEVIEGSVPPAVARPSPSAKALPTKQQVKEEQPQPRPRPEREKPRPAKIEKLEPVAVAPAPPPPDAREQIRTLINRGDTNALIEAERKIRELAETLNEPKKSEVTTCLDSQLTAPSGAAWRASLVRCLDRSR